MKKQQKKTKEITVPVYMMNRELSWLKFNERVLNEAGNPRVPLAERLTFAAIYQSNLDEFYRVRVGTLMDQMEASEVIRENKTNMTSEEQVTAIIQATRDLDQKKAAIYEQLMGELEPYGVRLINFNRLSAEEGKLLETYFDQEIAPYLSANIVSKQQPFPFLKNKNIYAVASLMSKGGKTKTAIIPCSNTVFRRLIDIPTRKGTFMLSEELILHFLPKMFKSYEIREKALLRITRNADIDADALYDEDLDYREFMADIGEEIDREVLHTSSYPAKAPVMAINSNALPNTAPDIPEEGGSADGGLEEGSSEDDGVYLPEEGSDSGSEDFFIPEE